MRNKQKGTARQLDGGLPKVNEITEWSFAEARLSIPRVWPAPKVNKITERSVANWSIDTR
jgi:hypothetical protein